MNNIIGKMINVNGNVSQTEMNSESEYKTTAETILKGSKSNHIKHRLAPNIYTTFAGNTEQSKP